MWREYTQTQGEPCKVHVETICGSIAVLQSGGCRQYLSDAAQNKNKIKKALLANSVAKAGDNTEFVERCDVPFISQKLLFWRT